MGPLACLICVLGVTAFWPVGADTTLPGFSGILERPPGTSAYFRFSELWCSIEGDRLREDLYGLCLYYFVCS